MDGFAVLSSDVDGLIPFFRLLQHESHDLVVLQYGARIGRNNALPTDVNVRAGFHFRTRVYLKSQKYPIVFPPRHSCMGVTAKSPLQSSRLLKFANPLDYLFENLKFSKQYNRKSTKNIKVKHVDYSKVEVTYLN